MAITMRAEQRTCSTKGDLRDLRKAGKIPGIIYGKQLGLSAPVSVGERELLSLLQSQPNAVLEIDVPLQGKHSVMVSDIQRDSLSGKLLHVDFHQISMNEQVKAFVRIDVEGDATGVREGGILQLIMHELELQCLPGNIPEMIAVDISALGIGESLLVSDLMLPQGVEAKADPQQVVLTILAPQKELSEDEMEDAEIELTEAKSRSAEAKHDEISTST